MDRRTDHQITSLWCMVDQYPSDKNFVFVIATVCRLGIQNRPVHYRMFDFFPSRTRNMKHSVQVPTMDIAQFSLTKKSWKNLLLTSLFSPSPVCSLLRVSCSRPPGRSMTPPAVRRSSPGWRSPRGGPSSALSGTAKEKPHQ